MVLPMVNPPAIPPPAGLVDTVAELWAAQGECVAGFFSTTQTLLETMGMSVCSCVALFYAPPIGRPFGALIHYDSGSVKLRGDQNNGASYPGVDGVFDAAIGQAGLNVQTVQQACALFLAYSEANSGHVTTAAAALNELTGAGYVQNANLNQFGHRGSAALDANGVFFDPHQDPPGPINGAAARRRARARCTIL